ncbi:hypothetical protein FGADI_10720 [Fusarium gaditjirri]|uniref:Xylose isomerase-like TIM barrel domain-containing protein n=1 Tax=Fusarium gaditjirri TaxID=282569 RepID=A0A8H4WRD8_9HYPO|nr:hypothetical protein FGADI_10720 [Fusarium gaditjirri]
MLLIKRFRTVWGVESGKDFKNWIPWFPDLKEQRYVGIEVDITDRDVDNLQQLRRILDNVGLKATVLIHTAWAGYVGGRPRDLTPDVHLDIYRQNLEHAKILKPVKINAQSGADYWSLDESVDFYQKTLGIDKERDLTGLARHETHCNRSLFTPYAANYILTKALELRVTADVSHWVVVCERLLDLGEDKEILDLLVPRVTHIHVHIGTTQSSQCPEPEDPVFKEEREFFERLWLHIIKARSQDNNLITFVPEHCPYPYHPYVSVRTHRQVADSEGPRLQKLFEDSLKE